ncbi:uncharacterized protein NPIL_339291 [Nephila pilipes]|uniref:Uncharacterized protein n=1 Tax=Nephila pilipes TaxID=299642 RepID=A0A8X6URN6_NEPPI|nr:uncharacterized protein NPIL_339291 [Nephila pilipes]
MASNYKEKMKVIPVGRYELEYPWKGNFVNILNNKEFTWHRHERINKLGCGKIFEDYQKVFGGWGNMNVVELVPELKLINGYHYFPHKTMIKMDS